MSGIFYGNVLKQNVFKGSFKYNERRHQMILTPASPKQKIAIEMLIYLSDKESWYQPTNVKLVGLFKKEFDDGGVIFSGSTTFDWVTYYVNFQKTKEPEDLKDQSGNELKDKDWNQVNDYRWFVKFKPKDEAKQSSGVANEWVDTLPF